MADIGAEAIVAFSREWILSLVEAAWLTREGSVIDRLLCLIIWWRGCSLGRQRGSIGQLLGYPGLSDRYELPTQTLAETLRGKDVMRSGTATQSGCFRGDFHR